MTEELSDSYEYTLIGPDDFQELKNLHEQLLPVRACLLPRLLLVPMRTV